MRERATRTDAWTLSQVAAAAGTLALRSPAARPLVDGLMWTADADHLFRDVGYLAAADRWLARREVYVDDNAWLGLVSVGAALARGSDASPVEPEVLRDLSRARLTLRLAVLHEDPDGGVYWKVGSGLARHACSTGPAGILALRVLEAERMLGLPRPDEASLLAFADRCSRFLARLVDSSGMVTDHMREDGSIEPAVFSYNQGTAIGLAVQQYRTSGDGEHLATAQRLAVAGWAFYGDGGRSSRLWTDPPAFVSIFCRNLLSLHAEDHDPRWRALVQRWTADAWTHGLDPKRGTLTAGDIGHYGHSRALDLAGLAYTQVALTVPPARLRELT